MMGSTHNFRSADCHRINRYVYDIHILCCARLRKKSSAWQKSQEDHLIFHRPGKELMRSNVKNKEIDISNKICDQARLHITNTKRH